MDTNTTHRKDMQQIVILPEDAITIKSQLFELCKHGDIDKNHEISFDEFASVITKFLPSSTDKRLHEMFNALDDNNDGSISYVEFLSEDNFNKFLEYCGYYTAPQETESSQNDIEVTDILTRCISIRNDHDKQIIMALQDVIAKLNGWISDTGKIAVVQCKELQTKNDALVHERTVYVLETQTMKQELNRVMEENKSIKHEYEITTRHKNVLSEKLKDLKETLQQSQNALEEYYNKELKWKESQIRNTRLIKENLRLKLKVDNELIVIDHLEKETSHLKEASIHRLHAMEEINEHDHELEDIIEELKHTLKQANETIAAKEAHIVELIERENEDEGTFDGLNVQKTVRFQLRMEESPAPVLNSTRLHYSDTDDENEPEMFEFHRNNSLLATPAANEWMPAYSVTPKQKSIDNVNNTHIFVNKISEYERKEMEWIKVKEDMKMENERLLNEVVALKDVDKVNKRLGTQLQGDENEQTPFIVHRNKKESKSFHDSFNPFCSIFKC